MILTRGDRLGRTDILSCLPAWHRLSGFSPPIDLAAFSGKPATRSPGMALQDDRALLYGLKFSAYIGEDGIHIAEYGDFLVLKDITIQPFRGNPGILAIRKQNGLSHVGMVMVRHA